MNRYRYYVGYFISRLQLLTSISEKRFHISFRPFQQHLYISDFVSLFASTPIAATDYAGSQTYAELCEQIIVHENVYLLHGYRFVGNKN